MERGLREIDFVNVDAMVQVHGKQAISALRLALNICRLCRCIDDIPRCQLQKGGRGGDQAVPGLLSGASLVRFSSTRPLVAFI